MYLNTGRGWSSSAIGGGAGVLSANHLMDVNGDGIQDKAKKPFFTGGNQNIITAIGTGGSFQSTANTPWLNLIGSE